MPKGVYARRHSAKDAALTGLSLPNLVIAKERYVAQRKASARRNIEWCFTFLEWACWWREQLGDDWLAKRGKFRNQFVMARKGDAGPYQAGNVRAIKATENATERKINGTAAHGAWMGQAGSRNAKAKLTEKDVTDIRQEADSGIKIADIAVKYKVCVSTIYRLRRHGWGHVSKCG